MCSLSTMLTVITFLYETEYIPITIERIRRHQITQYTGHYLGKNREEQTMSSYHHGHLREALLSEAQKQLEETGVEKLSLRALARSIGVSQTAPYRHFSDKNSLLDALAITGFQQLNQRFDQATSSQTDLDTALIEAGVSYAEFALSHTALYKLMFSYAQTRKDHCPELKSASEKCLLDLSALIQQRANITDTDELWYMTFNAIALVKGHTNMMLEETHNLHPETGEPINLRKALKLFLERVAGKYCPL